MPTPDPIALPELPATRFWADSMALDRPGVLFEHPAELFVTLKCARSVQFYQPLFTADQMRAYGQACVEALTPAPQVPGDMVLVPREATPEMVAAGAKVLGASFGLQFAYTAMLSATPPLNELLGQPEEFNLNEVSGNPGQLASLEQRARGLFEAQADPLAAPWERQWEPTKQYWRGQAAALSAQSRVTPGHWIEIGKAQALAEFAELRSAQRRELLAAPQPREVPVAAATAALHELYELRKGCEVYGEPAPRQLSRAIDFLEQATTPQDAAGVARIEPLDVTDAEISEWLERHDLAHAIRGSDARAAFEDAQSFHMTKPATTPPPGVDVGKLRGLAELAPRASELAERLVASGPKAAHVSASECHEIADFVRDAVAAIDAAAPGVQP